MKHKAVPRVLYITQYKPNLFPNMLVSLKEIAYVILLSISNLTLVNNSLNNFQLQGFLRRFKT